MSDLTHMDSGDHSANWMSEVDNCRADLAETMMAGVVGLEWDEACDSVEAFERGIGAAEMSEDELISALRGELARYEDM